MTTNKVTSDEAKGIALEIQQLSESIDPTIQQLKKKYEEEIRAFINKTEAQLKENFERLRLSMGMTQGFINPTLDMTYHKEHGEIYVHHGVEEKVGNEVDVFLKNLFNCSHH